MLLGSRSEERWLAPGTLEDNLSGLGGLDPEAASTLAERILERDNVTRYRQDEDFQQLLKLLNGFPLALEVVLTNLARQTPKQVLSALQGGDVTLDTPDSQKRTESILRRIDYSHSNLSLEAQQLLLCLAPFTSVLWLNMFGQYTTLLQQQPVLAALPFERWQEVLQEATNWGLLSPDPDIQRFLRLQPTLPYFLRNRLQAPEQAEVRHAVEAAFRELYNQIGAMLHQLLRSNDPKQRQVGQLLTHLEYENLLSALKLALLAQVSILQPYFALSIYVDISQDHRRGIALDQIILDGLDAYPAEKLAGPLGTELIRVLGTIANRQLQIKQYAAAEISYQKILQLAKQAKQIEAQERAELQGKAYAQLGKTAYEQRDWDTAKQYYQQALQIFSDFNDRRNQGRIYHLLGSIPLEQRQWQQAEQYYQQALEAYHNADELYEQALTYHQLGRVAEEQRQFAQARDYFLRALETFVAYEDSYSGGIVLRSLARLWQASGDANLPAAVASVMGGPPEEGETLLRSMLEEQAG